MSPFVNHHDHEHTSSLLLEAHGCSRLHLHSGTHTPLCKRLVKGRGIVDTWFVPFEFRLVSTMGCVMCICVCVYLSVLRSWRRGRRRRRPRSWHTSSSQGEGILSTDVLWSHVFVLNDRIMAGPQGVCARVCVWVKTPWSGTLPLLNDPFLCLRGRLVLSHPRSSTLNLGSSDAYACVQRERWFVWVVDVLCMCVYVCAAR